MTMVKNLRLFVEGGTDIKFLKDLISAEFHTMLPDESYVKIGGWTYLFSEKNINQFRRTKDEGGLNLVIIDADSNYEERYNWLIRMAITHRVLFTFFLWPNHQLVGDRESLLQAIASQDKYLPFASCFDSYIDCLNAHNNTYLTGYDQQLIIPNRKSRIYNYLELYGQATLERDRNYRDTIYWNLNHSMLEHIKTFLHPYFE